MAPAVDTYLDGELSPSQIVEVETHLTNCTPCRERVAFDRALRASMRKVVPLRAPTSLRERMAAAMAAERQRQAEARRDEERADAGLDDAIVAGMTRDVERPSGACLYSSTKVVPLRRGLTAPAPTARALTHSARPASNVVSLAERRPLRARYAVPFAVAAGVAFALSMRKPMNDTAAPAATNAAAAVPATLTASMGLDDIVEDLVSLHAQPLPPEVTAPEDVRRFDPFVGVPVEPPKLQQAGAQWVGGRMLPLRDSRAAMLQYSLTGGHRITVYVYDPRRVRPEGRALRQRMVRNAPVYVGNIRGYNVAATERRGVGYAIATDLDEPESVELVAASAP